MAHSDELPIPDYDQLPLTELRHRVRSLDDSQLKTLFDHETAHGNRIPVLEVLHARSKEIHHGAEPSSGDPANTRGSAVRGVALRCPKRPRQSPVHPCGMETQDRPRPAAALGGQRRDLLGQILTGLVLPPVSAGLGVKYRSFEKGRKHLHPSRFERVIGNIGVLLADGARIFTVAIRVRAEHRQIGVAEHRAVDVIGRGPVGSW